MRRIALVLALTTSSLAGMSADSLPPLLLQKPTLSRTHIAFVYAGDLWTVPRDGGGSVRCNTDRMAQTHGFGRACSASTGH
jgi:tricorn protease